jgi:photosynthetic reaction center cytochrome c subunit
MAVGYASLPYATYGNYLLGKENIRVVSTRQLAPAVKERGIKDAEATYGLMMHVSSALGVNCTFCHNAQSFQNWAEARPQRVTAYYGVRMVRDINDTYISSLTGLFPAAHAGPMGDPFKANCATCHQGVSKPMGGVSMLKDYPQLAPPPAAKPVVAGPAGDPANAPPAPPPA